MNKKGFTLVELLAVMALLGLIASISIYIVLNVVAKAREKTYEVTLSNIENKVNSYILENGDKLFFVASHANSTDEYQCITVKNLIDYGYLDNNIINSKVSDNEFVNVNNYVYIERNITTKAITRSIYVTADYPELVSVCGIATSVTGEIRFSSNPPALEWSKYKDITIAYRLNNVSSSGRDNYNYNYEFSNSNYEVVNDNGMTKVIRVHENGNLYADIRKKSDNSLVVPNTYSVNYIDSVGPTISVSTGTSTVRKSVTIPITVSDSGSGVNYESFTKSDIQVKVGSTVLSDSSITLSQSGIDGLYALKIDNIEYDGKVTIIIPSDSVLDNVSNGNNNFEQVTNITFNNIYQITFNANGGTISGTNPVYTRYERNVVYTNSTMTTVGNIPTATRDGYILSGWYTASSGGSKVLNANGSFTGTAVENYVGTNKWLPSDDVTLYARWTARAYTISYALNSGTSGSNAPTTGTYDSVVTIDNPTRSGYTFSGWTPSNWNANTAYYGTSTSAVSTQWSSSSTKVTAKYFKNLRSASGTVTLTANWTPAIYTVTLNNNGATTAGSSSTTVTYLGTTLGTITNPSKVITVSFNQNGTSATIGGAVTAWSSTLTGTYTLNGWYTATSDGSKVASNSTTPALQASVSGYTDANSKWTKTAGATLYATWGSPSITLPTITKDGYTCKWNSASDGTGSLTYASGGTYSPTSANTRTLYAICTAKPIYVFYNVNGGTLASGSVCKRGNGTEGACTASSSGWASTSEGNAYQICTYGNTCGPWDYNNSSWLNISKTGYTVASTKEWKAKKSDNTYVDVNQAKSYTYAEMKSMIYSEETTYFKVWLYVNWKSITYSVTYNSNTTDTVSNMPSNGTKTYGTNYTIASNVPTRTGYIFDGWNTKSDGTGTNYAAGSTYSTNAALTLYAKWVVSCGLNSYSGCNLARLCYSSNNDQTYVVSNLSGDAWVDFFNGVIKVGYHISKIYYIGPVHNTNFTALAVVTTNAICDVFPNYRDRYTGPSSCSSGKINSNGFRLLNTYTENGTTYYVYLAYMHSGCVSDSTQTTQAWEATGSSKTCKNTCNSGTDNNFKSGTFTATASNGRDCYQCSLAGNNTLGYAVWYQWGNASGNGAQCTKLSNKKSCEIYATN